MINPASRRFRRTIIYPTRGPSAGSESGTSDREGPTSGAWARPSACFSAWCTTFRQSSSLQAGELAVGSRRILVGEDRILPQQLLEPRGEEGGTEIEALVLVAAELGEQLQLLGRLHALRNHLQRQAMGE